MQVPQRQAFKFTAPQLFSAVRKRITLFVLLSAALASSMQLIAQTATPVTLTKAGRLLDPRSGHVLTSAAVVTEGDKIKQVGSASQKGVPA
jgi:hypothetical protein